MESMEKTNIRDKAVLAALMRMGNEEVCLHSLGRIVARSDRH